MKRIKPIELFISISLLTIALSIAYYFVIFLPGKEGNRQQQEQARIELRRICLVKAEQNRAIQWLKYCDDLGQLTPPVEKYYSNKITTIDGKKAVKDSETGIIYSLDENWIWQQPQNEWVPNEARIGNCKLSSDITDKIDRDTQTQKDECLKEYPVQ